MNSVKQERQDEAEIQEMAKKLMEANRAKVQAALRTNQTTVTTPQSMNILSFLTRTTNNNNNGTISSNNSKSKHDVSNLSITRVDNARSMGDEESSRGRFGWTTLGKVHIPYITRNGEKYCAVRMVEMKVLNKYLNFLHQDIYNCTCIRSYYITDVECRLLSEINMKHCDYQFGREQFTLRDLIVRLSDAVEFYNFLDACYTKLLNGSTNPLDRCGFIRINKESVVPYTMYNNQKYVPLFYFEGETENLKLKADKLEGWDLSYLKFCCKVQGIRNELFAHDSCAVISLNDIKNYFPTGTLFEDYWPSKVVDSQLLINGKTQTQMGQWTRQPAAPPAPHITPAPLIAPASLSIPSPSPKPATQPKAAINNNQIHNISPLYSSYGVTGVQPAPYPTTQPRAASSNLRTTYPAAISRQPRPYYAKMAQAPPPPLIRASQSFQSYGKEDWAATAYSNTQTTVANYMMLGDSVLSQSGYRPTNSQLPKFHPPPLIPVRHLNGGMRYDTPNHYVRAEVVDLSSANSTSSHPIINQQPAHQQPPRNQPTAQDDCSNLTNGRIPVNNMHGKLTAIPETLISGGHIPYKLQKALIENRMIPCINMKPFSYSDLLVTIPDLIEQLFNSVPVQSCQQVMLVLGIEIFKGNSAQMRLLMENGKCRSVDDVIPLVQLRHVLQYMPQLKYMLGGFINSELATKRQRTS